MIANHESKSLKTKQALDPTLPNMADATMTL